MILKRSLKRSKQELLVDRAERVFVGGVNSPVRSMNSVGIKPLLIKQGSGSRVLDFNDKEYIDYLLSFGAMILGHDFLSVERAIKDASEKGCHFGMTTLPEIELAETIQRAIPFIEKIRFVNSGTEAVMGAIRLVRGVTGRKKVIKFKHAYHGHVDYLLVDGGSGLSTLQIPLSKGVPEEFYEQTIVCDLGDYENLNKVFDQFGDDIAAVIIEPVGGNYGVIPPDHEFLRYVREITIRYESMLIFDEVITGFRFGFGSVADILGIKPDLICLGKIIGGGLPIGAYGGEESLMKSLSPLGDVYQASTFAGNPIVMSAGKAVLQTLESLAPQYSQLDKYVSDIVGSLKKVCSELGHSVTVSRYKSMFSLRFDQQEEFKSFYLNLLSEGVLFAPSEFEVNFISFSHTKEDIKNTNESIARAIRKI